ncbi:type II secretion system protein [Phycisphaeraceae bacterium D3-23]
MPINTPPQKTRSAGFTLIELLVVISIIGIMIGLLLPALANIRQDTRKVTCASNMRQIGLAFEAYKVDNKEIMPIARYMPPPLLSADTDPPLHVALEDQLPLDGNGTNAVWKCPDDDIIFDLSGSSYDYISAVGGQRLNDFFLIRMGMIDESQMVISRDFDNASVDLEDGEEQLDLPARHLRRNNLWGDGHVGVVNLDG